MQIKTLIDKKYSETEIHVCKDELDDEVKYVVTELHNMFDESLTGTDERGNKRVLRPLDIVSFYAQGQRVFAIDDTEKYSVSSKLYELEEKYGVSGFVRISKSEIVNFRKIKSLDMSLTGTIKVIMKNGYETYTSRRNVAKIKEMLIRNRGEDSE
jgi:Response regulator of the LytR/AlgR family